WCLLERLKSSRIVGKMRISPPSLGLKEYVCKFGSANGWMPPLDVAAPRMSASSFPTVGSIVEVKPLPAANGSRGTCFTREVVLYWKMPGGARELRIFRV